MKIKIKAKLKKKYSALVEYVSNVKHCYLRTTKNKDSIELSLIIPCYIEDDTNHIKRLLDFYATFPSELRRKFEIIFVDDCSPMPVLVDSDQVNTKVCKVIDDIEWNIPGARNLGVLVASGKKIALIDLDHQFSANALQVMCQSSLSDKEVWLFKRFKDNQPHITHKATLFMNRNLYWELNGCDEDFSGHYGSDGHLRACIDDYGCDVVQTHLRVDTSEKICGTKQHNLVRDTEHNSQLMKQKNRSPIANHSKRILRFSWKMVSNSRVSQ